jgi:tetratricopeptide (TPR) repeat protein
MSHVYETAFQLLKAGDPVSVDQGVALFRAEVEARPADMKALFEYAGAFDFLGKEAEALPHYEKVLQAGYEELPEDDQPRLFVQLGSTLRNLKQFVRSREVLLQGLQKFPDFQAIKAFLALTEYSSGDHAKAMQLLFEVTLENRPDPSISDYRRALGRYSEKISTFP